MQTLSYTMLLMARDFLKENFQNIFFSNNQYLCFTDVSWQQLGGFSKQRKEWG
jgi:hypothetical protein